MYRPLNPAPTTTKTAAIRDEWMPTDASTIRADATRAGRTPMEGSTTKTGAISAAKAATGGGTTAAADISAENPTAVTTIGTAATKAENPRGGITTKTVDIKDGATRLPAPRRLVGGRRLVRLQRLSNVVEEGFGRKAYSLCADEVLQRLQMQSL